MGGIEIPGVGGRGRLYLTLHCHHRGTGGDRDPRRWGKRKTMSPPEVLEGIEIPGGGGRGRLCHHQRYWRGPRSQEVGGEGTIPNTTLSPPEVLAGTALLSVLMTKRRGWGGGVYTYRYTVSTRTICALGWSTTTNISMFHSL